MRSLQSVIDSIIIGKQGGQKSSALIRERSSRNHKVNVEMYTYGSCFDPSFNIGGEVHIGRYTSFGPNVHYFGANHAMTHASMSPYFYQKSWGGVKVKDVERHKLEVGNDCWIGYGTVITCNCHKIGNGAVIGAGSIVTKDVEPYSIVAGNPARVIRYRFDADTIAALEKSKWWEFEPEVLLEYYDFIDQPKVFAEKIIVRALAMPLS